MQDVAVYFSLHVYSEIILSYARSDEIPSWHFMMVVAGKPGIVIDYGEAKSTDGRLFRR